MDTARKIGLVGLGIVLFVSLLAANGAVALDRTALDSEYAKDKAAEAGLYETFAEELRQDVVGDEPTDDPEWPLERTPDEHLESALTDEYVRSQGETNIDAIYVYLHGETDEISVEFETDPLKESVLEGVESDTETLELGAVMPSPDEIERVPDEAGIEAMAEDRTTFEDARAQFRADRKEEIQEETERELSDEELEQRLDESMDDIRAGMLDQLDAELDGEFEGTEAPLEEPVRTLQTARIDALTGDITYEEYAETVETARTDLEDAFLEVFETELDEELPGTVDFTEEFGEEETEALETAQTGVSTVSTLAIALPIFVLLLVGSIGYLAPRSIAAIEVGTVSLLAGVIGIVGSVVATGQLRAVFDPADSPPAMGEFMLSFVAGILSAVTWQSAFLATVGVIALAVGLAIRWEYL